MYWEHKCYILLICHLQHICSKFQDGCRTVLAYQAGGKGEEGHASSLLKTFPGSYICYYHVHFTGQNVDTWSNLATKEAKKYSVYAGDQYAQPKFMIMLLRRRGRRVSKDVYQSL